MMSFIPENCTYCKTCEQVCPTMSLDLEKNTMGDYCINCNQCFSICPVRSTENDKEVLGHYTQNPISANNFENLMQQRRSIRKFQDKTIPNETLVEFIKNMRFSPTASNSQGLSFTVITDKNKLKAINDISIKTLLKLFNKVTSPMVSWMLKVVIGKAAYSKLQEGKNKFSRKACLDANMICYNAPALILIHAAKGASSMPESDANIWIGMATLYAQTLKLATCINGYIVNAVKRNKELKALMNIPKHHHLHGAVLIGYPKLKYQQRVDRQVPRISID